MRESQITFPHFQRLLKRMFVLPLVLAAILCASFLSQLYYLISAYNWVDHTDQVISETQELSKSVLEAKSGLRGFLLTGKRWELDGYHSGITLFTEKIHRLRVLVADNPNQVQRFDQVRVSFKAWLDFSKEEISRKETGKDYISPLISPEARQITNDLVHNINTIIDVETQLRSDRKSKSTTLVLTSIILTVVLGLGTGILIALKNRKSMTELGQSYDEIVKRQANQNEVLQNQTWLKSGQVELSTRTAGESGLDGLCREALHFISNYVGASIGALYVTYSNSILKRVSTFAFPPDISNSPTEIKFGETLVGQTALSSSPCEVSNLPKNYVKIVSGIGSIQPDRVLLYPLFSDASKKVRGVIELGFLGDVEPKVRDYISSIIEKLGVSITSCLISDQLKELLSKTQQQAEELQTQQEELRVSNEELQQQAEALKEAQASLENQQAELEQTNEQLTEQASILEHQAESLRKNNEALAKSQTSLEKKAAELRASNQYKAEFLANMSHELRTPLNSTLILAKLLADNKDGNLTSEQVQFAETIYSAGNDLLKLINDILDLSKVEAGKLEVQPEEASISSILSTLRRTFNPVSMQKNLEFIVSSSPDAPTTIWHDSMRIEQILKNFLSNAFKFTEQGSVRLIASKSERGVLFSVEDTGVGIREADQKLIFEAFRQAEGGNNRKYGGTGLGLSISRDLAKLLGGEVSVKSTFGKGSVFTLDLPIRYHLSAEQIMEADWEIHGNKSFVAEPLAKPSKFTELGTNPTHTFPDSHNTHSNPKGIPTGDAVPGKSNHVHSSPLPFEDDRKVERKNPRTILVVEDDPHFLKILYDLAHELHFNCIIAQSAEDGFNTALTYLPDAILLDMKLPDHSGLAVLDRLKETSKTRHIPVHVISGNDMTQVALQMGAVGYLMKPVKRKELEQAFKKLEDNFTQKFKKVLVVEDDTVQRESMCKLIEEPEIEILSAGSAAQAVQLLRSTKIDCMIIDLGLPDMSGYELLERMSSDPTLSSPPVIVYTGRSLERQEEERLRKYSQSIIIKGARSPERLLDDVSLFLHRVESQMPHDRQRILKELRNREKILDGRQILIVDDDIRNIFALTSALEQKGASIIVGRNGKEALMKLEQNPQIDLILMDIMMPEMDGHEAMKLIRKEERFARLPIIAITAKAMKDDQERCLSSGANDYLAKPIDIEKLLSLIRIWLPPTGQVS